jgi:hypothetical protein
MAKKRVAKHRGQSKEGQFIDVPSKVGQKNKIPHPSNASKLTTQFPK